MERNRRIVFFIVDGFQPLDLFGPLEAFAAASALADRAYGLTVAAPCAGTVTTESRVGVLANTAIDEAGPCDTLLIVGGAGPREYRPSPGEKRALDALARSSRRVGSICTGAFLLCELGLGRSRRVATHWRHAEELRSRACGADVDAGALFVKDGTVWTSAGITAGIDMALAMIAEDAGPAVSAAVARQLVVYLRRPGDQAQFSEPLEAQAGDAGRLAAVIDWAVDHLDECVSVETLAERASMSPRHFGRLFRANMASTPARFIERLRLDRARAMLGDGNARISMVAAAVGFDNPDSFRRAFERRFAVSPSEYRARFALEPAAQENP